MNIPFGGKHMVYTTYKNGDITNGITGIMEIMGYSSLLFVIYI